MPQTIPFDPDKNLAPTPFDETTCVLAQEMKNLGLDWEPHVGCFVWDPEHFIKTASPFPNRVYFILSLPRFIDIFGSPSAIREKLVWLPTWHQARQLCDQYGLRPIARIAITTPTDELQSVYRNLIHALSNQPA